MVKPVRKRIRRKRHTKIPGQETPAERQARTAVAYITRNPEYQAILRAIRSGVENSKIAEHFIARGVFDVNQRTAVGYLQYFRKTQPALCRPQAPTEVDEQGRIMPGIDHLFEGANIIIDEETELLRAIALQKARLGMAFESEREISMLMRDTRKEVEELRNLLMDLAKLRGLVGNTLDVNLHGYSESVKDDLKGIKQDENQRSVITSLVADLGRNAIAT